MRIRAEQLPHESPQPLPLNEAAEAQRAPNVGSQFGSIVPGLVEYTTEYLFRDLWLRPDLAPRDRSLVTVAALLWPNAMSAPQVVKDALAKRNEIETN